MLYEQKASNKKVVTKYPSFFPFCDFILFLCILVALDVFRVSHFLVIKVPGQKPGEIQAKIQPKSSQNPGSKPGQNPPPIPALFQVCSRSVPGLFPLSLYGSLPKKEILEHTWNRPGTGKIPVLFPIFSRPGIFYFSLWPNDCP